MSRSIKAIDPTGDPLVGQTLGNRYAMKRIIGRGGVGLVYLARDEVEPRDVVVKVLAPQWAQDDEALARFDREAKRLNNLRHPNIVAMYDFGQENRTAYLVMEYLQGELLSAYVDRNAALTLEQFVPIAAQILKGIGHAHSREMMVRDIKPANVMLCERKGRANFVKILDFGLAKLIKGDAPITEEHVMGTVGYLSPEQIKGEALDLRVDVYALGVMFYYMLAGHAPFHGDNNAAIFYKTVNEEPRNLREVARDGAALPDGLVALVHDCLAKPRGKRPRDADEIVERLIDVVPAAMFRLPKSETAQGVPALPPGYGNTGMMELLAAGEPEVGPSARRRETPEAGTRKAITRPIPVAETAPSTPSTSDLETGAHSIVPRRSHAALVAAIVGVLGVAGGAWLLTRDGEPPKAVAAVDEARPEERSAEIAARPEETREAERNEPSHDASKEPAPDPTPTPPTEAALGRVEIDSSPLANLYIDGEAKGTTPYEGELPIGHHEVRMTARGHQPWQGTIEVTREGTAPLAITLTNKRSGKPAGGRTTPEPTPAPEPKPEPKPDKPAPTSEPPTAKTEPAADKPSPFLPTKKPDKKSVFLPTKDEDPE
jgi:serine/threonine protein kinase